MDGSYGKFSFSVNHSMIFVQTTGFLPVQQFSITSSFNRLVYEPDLGRLQLSMERQEGVIEE